MFHIFRSFRWKGVLEHQPLVIDVIFTDPINEFVNDEITDGRKLGKAPTVTHIF
jgi:hypothetical protein